MLSNVKKATIEPFIKKHIAPQSQVYTDEYNIYDDLESWGFRHKTVCHGKGVYARDDEGEYPKRLYPFTLAFLSFCIILAEEAKACFSP